MGTKMVGFLKNILLHECYLVSISELFLASSPLPPITRSLPSGVVVDAKPALPTERLNEAFENDLQRSK